MHGRAGRPPSIGRPFPIMIIDTHSHLNFNAFQRDLDEVLKRTLAENIWTINVGTRYETSKRAVEIAEKQKEAVFAAIGLHPLYAAAEFVKTKTDPEEGDFLIKDEVFDKEKYKNLAKSSKVVAVGEIGLDYYYKPKTTARLEQFKQKQKEIFIKQLDLAEELNLPVIIHCRMAHGDVIEIFKSRQGSARGAIHCFTGSKEEMGQYINLGFYIGFNGIIFKLDLDEAVKKCPIERMLVETDCPYLTPPQENGKRNEPIFVKHTIQKIAELRGEKFEKIAEATTQNSKKLFFVNRKNGSCRVN